MTRWAESPGAAGEHKKPLLSTVGTPDAGKAAPGVAAVEITLDHILDDRPEEAVFSIRQSFLIIRDLEDMLLRRTSLTQRSACPTATKCPAVHRLDE
jgi:hypothetical protein